MFTIMGFVKHQGLFRWMKEMLI